MLQKKINVQPWTVSYVKILIGKEWDPEAHMGTSAGTVKEEFPEA